MFEKDTIAIDIGSTNIKIMVGNKKNIKNCGLIKTPTGSFMDDRLINIDHIKDSINQYLTSNNIREKEVSFAIHGQDIIARHTEVPIMDESGIRNSVEWEIKQNLPRNGEDYYIDFEIIDRISGGDKKIYKLLVVAAPKEKINRFLELANSLKLELRSIDITANCACRVFKDISKNNASSESIAVVDIGNKNSNIIIIDKGKLFIEREIPFGINNVVKEIVRRQEVIEEVAADYIYNEFTFHGNEEGTEIEKRILVLFDNVFSTFEKIIQFYTTGKTKKNVDKMYFIGGGCNVSGLAEYAASFFNTEVDYAKDATMLGLKCKLPNDCEFKFYVSTLGLLLRKE